MTRNACEMAKHKGCQFFKSPVFSFKVVCRLIIPLFFEFIAFLATNKYPFSIFRPSWKNTRRSVMNWRIMRAPSRLCMIKLTLLVKMTGKAEQVTFPFPFYWNLHYISTFFLREIFNFFYSHWKIELHWQEVPRTPGVSQVEKTTFVGRIEFVQTFHRSRWCWAMDQRKRKNVGHHGSRQVVNHFNFFKL